MKYKAAARQLLEADMADVRDVEALYSNELSNRVYLRSHGVRFVSVSLMDGVRFVSVSLMDGVLKEMDEWIVKVCRAIGWNDRKCEKVREICRKTAETLCSMAKTYR